MSGRRHSTKSTKVKRVQRAMATMASCQQIGFCSLSLTSTTMTRIYLLEHRFPITGLVDSTLMMHSSWRLLIAELTSQLSSEELATRQAKI